MENKVTRMSIQRPSCKNKKSEALLFSVPSRTPRCTMPNNNPSTGERSKSNEPLKTMKSYLVIDKGSGSPCLGMGAVPLGSAVNRTIHVGDEVVLDGTGEHLYIKDPTKEAWAEVW